MKKNKFISIGVSISFLLACSTPPKHTEDFEGEETYERRTPAALPTSMPQSQVFKHHQSLATINWKDLFYELSYINVAKQAKNDDEFKVMVSSSMYYAKQGFNKSYWDIVNLPPTSTDDAYKKREELLGMDANAAAKFDSKLQLAAAGKLGANNLIATLAASAKDPKQKLDGYTNYFKTASGQAVLEALKDYVLVVVPGFGSHTIKDYAWPEILRQINEYYGRKDPSNLRMPYQRTSAADENTAQNDLGKKMIEFYARKQDGSEKKFDIIHPLGYELGFSMGKDADSANELANRLLEIKQLPDYANKKFILLGYSKGAPIATKMVAQRPDIGKDVVAVVTMAGVVQGALPANTLMKDLYKETKTTKLEDLQREFSTQYEAIRAKYTSVADGFVNKYLTSETKQNLNRRFTEFFGQAFNLEGSEAGEALKQQRDRQKLLEGISDMSNFQSLQWNLTNMNDGKFTKPITFFNFSMLTNVKDFVLPTGVGKLVPPTLVPQITSDFGIDYSKYSRDNVFLYLTSIGSFEEAAGGLFDTQVEWLDTKSIFLDSRPLALSLSKDQLQLFNETLLEKNQGYRIQFANYYSMPRYQLIGQELKLPTNNINVVDLGEFRGTHWDVAFEQVYKPGGNVNYYRHRFPRRAIQASVVEMLAIYKTVGGFQ